MSVDADLILVGQLAMAVVAGLLLNLTPCVLPAIPIKVRTILAESGTHQWQRMLAGLAFLGGALALFLTVGALTAYLQWSWGVLFQSTGFLIALVVVLLVFAAITWLDVPLPVPQFAARIQGHRHLEAFLSGLLSAVLATPCAGPFLGGVLAFAVTQPPHVIMWLFSGMAVGLALPYVVLMLNPTLLKKLPRAGDWSRTVREFLAFVLLGAAVFFSASLVPEAVSEGLWWFWLALLMLWTGIRFLRGSRASRYVVMTLTGVSLVVMAVYAAPRDPSTKGDGIGWQPYSEKRLAKVQQHQPHLIEFTADWCINCKVLEHSVYASSTVAAVVKKNGVVPIQVDLTSSNPGGEQLLGDMGGQALPFAAVVDRDGEVTARFTGLFSESSLIRALQEAAGRGPNNQGRTE
ncbi:protein-disulfide reductase DsbD family protein [Marinobacter sp. R17]|uniref:protein-disulfide reductase DsbD family protein n=1 Tax=Marinobacter sp. R17 TaxID=2484250 RepID=UPI001CC21683|nr:cytochrome c biogenesis protein CcdA [Marinobacter sp. R17]